MTQLLARFDSCSHLIVAIICYVVARKAAESQSRLGSTMRYVATITFLIVFIVGNIEVHSKQPEQILGIVIIAWIAASLSALIAFVILVPASALAEAARRAESHRRQMEQDADYERLQQQEAERRNQLNLAHQRQWEHDRPERERIERERVAQAKSAATEQRRRGDARAECLLFFNIHAPEIGTRFTRSQLDEYLKTYLNDDQPAPEVEEHAAKLIRVMTSHVDKTQPRLNKTDFPSLGQWYQATKLQIESQSVDDRTKRAQLAQLAVRYAELAQEHLEESQP